MARVRVRGMGGAIMVVVRATPRGTGYNRDCSHDCFCQGLSRAKGCPRWTCEGDDGSSGGGDEREGSFEKQCVGFPYPCTCAGQKAAQLSIFGTLQRRRTPTSLLLITSLALETARRVGSRGQLKRRGGLTRVAGTALHASGELSIRWALDLC